MVQTIAGIVGCIVIVLGLIGFVRSIWPTGPTRERNHEDWPSTTLGVPESHHQTGSDGNSGANP